MGQFYRLAAGIVRLSPQAVRDISLELKAWNLDQIARNPSLVRGMLEQLEAQVVRYQALRPDTIYALRQAATTPAGVALQLRISELLGNAQMSYTFGINALMDLLG